MFRGSLLEGNLGLGHWASNFGRVTASSSMCMCGTGVDDALANGEKKHRHKKIRLHISGIIDKRKHDAFEMDHNHV